MTGQPASQLLGRWRIVEIEGWDAGYVDMIGPGHIQFDRDGGTIEFGAVQIGLECWYSPTGVHFNFHGSDEGTEVSGDGDADLEPDDILTGEIRFHNGDDMPFTAKTMANFRSLLGVVRDIADQVVVMRGGQAVEAGPVQAVLDRPRHAYTRALIAAMPGLVPPERAEPDRRPVLEVTGLSKTYHARAGWFRPARTVHAVRDISFTIAQGETLGVVGESGSGKSTLARLVTRLLEADAGSIRLEGVDLGGAKGHSLRQLRRRIPMVFQDPFASLNPRRRVGDSIMDGAVAQGLPRRQARAEAVRLLEQVGLQGHAAGRYPHEFSGGQRQRIGIARALAMRPTIIVADEPVSALDVSVQTQVLALLEELKRTLQLSLLFITHDLNVAAQLCDRVAVMRQGEIVEIGRVDQVLGSPTHPYTKMLIDAVPGRASRRPR